MVDHRLQEVKILVTREALSWDSISESSRSLEEAVRVELPSYPVVGLL